MTQFKADRDMLTTADSGWRDPRACLWGMFHTTENTDATPPENIASWQLDRANDSSYNMLFGADATGARTVRSNDDNYSPWSSGMPGNRLAIHGSAVGYASRSRQDWLNNPRQLEQLARWAADLHTRYGLPLKWLTVAEVAGQRVKGFTSHAVYWQAIARAQGMDVRTDPGSGFPHDVVLARAAAIARGDDDDQGGTDTIRTPSDDQGDDDGGDMADNRLDLALDQLVGHPWQSWQGWEQLAGLSLVDAVATIGHHLGVEGFKDMREDKSENIA